jgi:hypothetical protein
MVIPNDQFFALVERGVGAGESLDIRVQGTSMYPALIDRRHRVVLVRYKPAHRRVGMIALIRHEGRHILHRLVAIRGDVMIFRGDNTPHAVEKVTEGDVVAVVRSIIAPSGRVSDCRGWRFAVASRWVVMTSRPRMMFMAMIAGLSAKIKNAATWKKR